MERATSIYGSSSALRGVQLKIGEKFRPPAKITLPVGWKMRDPSRLLSLSYDFSLEENVIAKIKAEREAKEQYEQAQKIKELKLITSTANPAVANMGSDILQPTTATTNTTTTTNTPNTTNENNHFNYKDFEDNTDTPFESVELQCINNMEALKSVLQPDVETDSATSSQSQIPQGTNAAGNIPAGNIPAMTSGMPIKRSGNPFTTHASSHSLETNFPISGSPPIEVSAANPFPLTQMGQTIPQYSNPFLQQKSQTVDEEVISRGIVSVSPHSNTVSYSSGNTVPGTDKKISLPGAMRVLPVAPARPPPRRPASVQSDGSDAFPGQGEPTTAQKRPVPKPRSKLPPLRNGPETSPSPDIIYDVPPPPLPPKTSIGKSRNMDHAQKPDVPMDDVNLKRFPTPLPPISPPKPEHPPPFNDPCSTMSAEERQFAKQISAMGFPLARVARAVKNLGCKEPEVIEFLISVNDMCNLGYSEGQVEMVLKDNNDQTKAEEFLKLIKQFKELGFQEEKIFEALKKSECDSNKTLDILTCAG